MTHQTDEIVKYVFIVRQKSMFDGGGVIVDSLYKVDETKKDDAAKEIVEAEKKVKLAAQTKLENEQKALAAEFYKQEQILMGEGEAERKRLVMEADGALAQKLATFEKVTIAGYQEFGKQKWVSEITMGSNGSDEGVNSAQALIDLLMVNNAKALNLDMKIKQ